MIPAIIGAVGAVIAAVVVAVVAGNRSRVNARQKFLREMRAPMYNALIEKARALSRELWVIRFNVGNAATISPAVDIHGTAYSVTGERRTGDWRTAGYHQAYDKFLEAVTPIAINGSHRALRSVDFMRKSALKIDESLRLGDTNFVELSARLGRYVDLFDKEMQRAISIIRRDLGTAD